MHGFLFSLLVSGLFLWDLFGNLKIIHYLCKQIPLKNNLYWILIGSSPQCCETLGTYIFYRLTVIPFS